MLLTLVVPVDRTMVLLGAANGRFWTESPRKLQERLILLGGWNPIWMTTHLRVAREVAAEGGRSALSWTPRGVWLLLRARHAVFSHSVLDITTFPGLIPRRLAFTYTTHDVSPKRSRAQVSGRQVSTRDRMLHAVQRRVTRRALSPSPFMSEVLAEQTALPSDIFIEIGLPKVDDFVQSVRAAESGVQTCPPDSQDDIKDLKVLYAPTWRSNRAPINLLPLPGLEADMADWLERERILIDIRPHKNDMKYPGVRARLAVLEASSPRVNSAAWEREQSVSRLLPDYDVLISDYSGIIHEFLLLDRPIVLLPYDYDDFLVHQGFIYDYITMAAGPIITNFKELASALSAARDVPDGYSGRRAALRHLIWSHQPSSSTDSLIDLLKD